MLFRAAALVSFVFIFVFGFTPHAVGQSVNTTLLAQIDEFIVYSDCWGYVSPAGEEYGIIAHYNGTAIYNITDPANSVLVGDVPGPTSPIRDIKVYDHYAYIVNGVSNPSSGLQIVDLSFLPDSVSLVNTFTAEFLRAHNIFIDTTRALLYACGTESGMHVLDLGADPVNPVQVDLLSESNYYVHDMHVSGDVVWAFAIFQGEIHILSNSPDGSNLQEIGSFSYADASPHSGWLSTDKNFLLSCDEQIGGFMRIWNVSNLTNIKQTSTFFRNAESIHNVFVRDNLAYISYYDKGMRVINIDDPWNPFEVAFYDTYNGFPAGFAGCFGVYPFLPSGNILASDNTGGLFVFSLAPYFTDVVSGSPVLVGRANLFQNAPNPFNPTTSIRFEAGDRGQYIVAVYDVSGRKIRTLFHGNRGGEELVVSWDGRDSHGRPVPSGSYFYRLTGPQFSDSMRMTLLR